VDEIGCVEDLDGADLVLPDVRFDVQRERLHLWTRRHRGRAVDFDSVDEHDELLAVGPLHDHGEAAVHGQHVGEWPRASRANTLSSAAPYSAAPRCCWIRSNIRGSRCSRAVMWTVSSASADRWITMTSAESA